MHFPQIDKVSGTSNCLINTVGLNELRGTVVWELWSFSRVVQSHFQQTFDQTAPWVALAGFFVCRFCLGFFPAKLLRGLHKVQKLLIEHLRDIYFEFRFSKHRCY